MSELRYNTLLDDYTIISSNRQQRPQMPDNWCPFCPSNENDKVPKKYDVYKYDNDFPNMVLEFSTLSDACNTDEMFMGKSVYGKCEVILYHSSHTITLPQLPTKHIKKIVDLWCQRFYELSQDENIKYILIFENRGKEAGVTMPHPHGQLYAFSYLPKNIQVQLTASKNYLLKNKSCLICDMLKKEMQFKQRMVCENESFAVFVPFATPWPYGTYVVAKDHVGNMNEFTKNQKNDLADIMKKITGTYDSLFDYSFPYMMTMMQTPVNIEDASEYYHFHIEFFPPMRAANKQYFRASCETGGGAYCNVTFPEEKAEELRKAYKKFISK